MLSEVFDPQAQPSRRDPPLPSLCLLGSRCALTLTMRLGAFLPRRPPWYRFNQARSRDPRPSELDLTWVAAAPLGARGPSCDWPCRTAVDDVMSVIGASSELEAGLASGLVPIPVGARARGSLLVRESWLSWVSPPWGSPLPCSDLYGTRAIRRRLPRGPALSGMDVTGTPGPR